MAAISAPRLPMTSDEYGKWRRMLWSQRGPNVATPSYEGLLPCYRHALARCEPLARGPPAPTRSNVPAPAPAPQTAADNEGASESAGATRPLTARRELVVSKMLAGVAVGAEEPFYIVDLEAAQERLALWRELLPDIEPHYAAKCNGDPALLLTLAHGGCGFDCASKAEIEEVLALGVPASRLLYANPIKQPSHLRFAAQRGVNLTVFDGEAELHKIASLHPASQLLLRIAVDDSQAQCVLSNKYGAPPSDCAQLLSVAAELRLNVVGVSFHVGSGSSSGDAFRDAVERAAAVFKQAAAAGAPMSILDVGGGFPGVDTPEVFFAAMAASLRAALTLHFPKEWGVRYIAEPGRFFAASTHTLAASIIGKKIVKAPRPPPAPPPSDASAEMESASVESKEGTDVNGADDTSSEGVQTRINYYINDGLYGSFNCVLYDHASPECEVLPTAGVTSLVAPPGTPLCSVWGPTCDGIDCVLADASLPDLSVGAWLFFPDMGAYTSCAGSNFNGMSLPDVIYLQSRAQPAAAHPATACAAMLEQMRADSITPNSWQI
uniref:ornithine decarboxylase n=1 Tax=Haptolina brevifila TaxID=156173 RepID=A0A7S2MG87_9EUKA